MMCFDCSQIKIISVDEESLIMMNELTWTGEVILLVEWRMVEQVEHSRVQMGECMQGEEERLTLWSGDVEHGTSREGDLEPGGVSECEELL